MNVGIVCYASVGGSGIIATELGKRLAKKGHRVHVLSSDMPARLGDYQPGLSFHRVETPSYPLFREPQYLLSLANKIVQVSRAEDLEIVHAHYAIPHATAGYLARQILAAAHGGACVPRVITTLHGTDITLLGADRSYSEIVAFSIEQSDAVTAVSDSLKADTYRELGVSKEIRVIPNFVDCSIYKRVDATGLRERFAPNGQKLIVHVSNFRPVKRIRDVLGIFERVQRRTPARLLLIGDGPDRSIAEKLAREGGFSDKTTFLGNVAAIETILPAAKLLLLPSDAESFGLAALEAMACGVPVIGTAAGGLPEVVEDGVEGFLRPVGDVEGMASGAIRLIADDALWQRFSAAARRRAEHEFPTEGLVSRYRELYEKTLSG